MGENVYPVESYDGDWTEIRKDYTKKRASFFRRHYENKHPENAIDFEEVLVMRRP